MKSIIDSNHIQSLIAKATMPEKKQVGDIIQKSLELHGLSPEDILNLLMVSDPILLKEIFHAASEIKEKIYGKRLVLFAPLYISNLCANECLYCAFRNENKGLHRKALSQEEIRTEVETLINQGQKRLLLVAGESYNAYGLDYVIKSIETTYKTQTPKGNIRRVNVNIAPLEEDEFRRLNEAQIGTYQLFQETYHEETYKKIHLKGPKKNYQYRLETMDRALRSGIKDVGIGLLFGLHDYRFEILSLFSHIQHLESEFGIGPHTISVPRLEPAYGSNLSYNAPAPVSDQDFKKIIAILRMAVPYTGIILSTRENPSMRHEALNLGVSQISAGSMTNPGGYKNHNNEQDAEQFSLGDTRPLAQVIEDIVQMGYIPSFCTGCYRLGRIGQDFMDLAQPGLIKDHCLPNAMFTFAEYLDDFASPELKEKGYALIEQMMTDVSDSRTKDVLNGLEKIKKGKRDIYL